MKNILLRATFVIIQLLFIAFSIALIVLGAWLSAGGATFSLLASDVSFSRIGGAVISIGVVVIVIALIGIVGALCETHFNKLILIFYIVLVVVIFIAELGLGVLAFAFRDGARDLLVDSLNETHFLYGGNSSEAESATSGWDMLQRSRECCGIRSPLNWTDNVDSIPGLNSSVMYPLSCCIDETIPECGTSLDTDVIYQEGCLEVILRDLDANIAVVAFIGITFLVGEVLVIMMSICLLCFGGRGHE